MFLVLYLPKMPRVKKIKGIQKCRQTFYSMSYPGLPTDIKSHLWRTVCCPTFLYGMEAFSLSKIQFKNIESTQGSLIKQSLGLSKYSHHSKLLTAVNVSRCVEIINNCGINLWRRIFKVDPPLRIIYFVNLLPDISDMVMYFLKLWQLT